MSGDPNVREWVRRVREGALAAYEHQDVPFEKLVEELAPVRDLSVHPLFQVMFVLQNAPSGRLELEGLKWRRQDVERRTAKFDLVLALAEGPEGLEGTFEYNSDLLEASSVQRLGRCVQSLLSAMVLTPDARVSRLSLLSEGEEKKVLEGWNSTIREYEREKSLGEMASLAAGSHGDRVAVEYGAEQVSYGELEVRSNRVARWLRKKGVKPEVFVGLYLERGIEAVVWMVGIVKAGGAYVPMDVAYPAERVRHMAEDAGLKLAVSQKGLKEKLGGVAGLEVADVEEIRGEIGRESGEAVESGAGGESLAYMIYTSGSTGRPKGVCVTHRGVMRLVRNSGYIELGREDVVGQASNLSFDAATFEVWGALLNGSRLVGITKEVAISPVAFAQELEQRGVNVLFLTTALFNQMAREKAEVFGRMRTVLFGGEKVEVEWVRKVLKEGKPGRLLHVYGPTECTTYATWQLVEEVKEGQETVPIGRGIGNTQVYVLDGERQVVPVGVVGELYIGGDGLARGYWKQEELTREKFVENPFKRGERMYRTGDQVKWNERGELEFVGRKDGQVKIRGFRIELGEIEAEVKKCEGVKEGVVEAREEGGERRLVGYVVWEEGKKSEVRKLREELKKRLPEYMVPAGWVELEKLPLTPNGKVDRKALPAPEGATLDREAYAAPEGLLEETISRIWAGVLKVDGVGRDDNFFDLGGHSLLLVQVHSLLEARLGRKVQMVDLFHYPTVASLAAHLSGARAGRKSGGRRVSEDAIAIIGMAGRFPGARDIEEFWQNLKNGVESIRFFTEEELESSGLDSTVVRHPSYIKARGYLPDTELFDASFFGFSPREAELIDPQQRFFLETAWEALESGGYDPERFRGRIGVFGGASLNSYIRNLTSDGQGMPGGLHTLISSERDFMTTRVSYKLNLRGPSLNVQTACSTSLVSIHLACVSLRAGECEMALAGGASINVPQLSGYQYVEDGVMSPDGHCRAFDAKAKGAVRGSGVGVVLLKPLSMALADRDTIHAVIIGSAINNDGSSKVGYTAPSVAGQTEVITEAQAQAGVSPATISYVEAHGTGTPLGDPIEIAALTQAFGRAGALPAQSCAIGSLKTNVGHLDAAAGVPGL